MVTMMMMRRRSLLQKKVESSNDKKGDGEFCILYVSGEEIFWVVCIGTEAQAEEFMFGVCMI